MNEVIENAVDGVAFVGETLGPFFLCDPARDAGKIAPAFEAMASIDVDAAAEEWPFVRASDAHAALALLVEGASKGAQSEENVWEYRRLFVGPNAKPAPPWGSVYTDRECVVFGASCLALRQWMREQGIRRMGDAHDPEDHIGLLLLMIAWIARNKPDVLEDCLRLHVLPWSSHMLECMERAAEQPFYQGLAALARLSLEGMQESFGVEVDYPRFYR